MNLPKTLIELIYNHVDFFPEADGTVRRMAEIGVHKGSTSKELIKEWPDCFFVFVDPWKEWPEGAYKDRRMGKLRQDQWDKIYEEALENIQPNEKRVIHRTTSDNINLNLLYPSRFFDVVFIDANHTYEAVKKDIELWLPLVAKGGLICGHDYGGRARGVKQAVDEKFNSDEIECPGSLIWGVTVK